MRTIPWVREIAKRYADKGLTVVGIHTPEFDHERDRTAVAAEVRRHGLDYPHLLDNDHAYWNALDNQYWPSLYLVDRCGQIRLRHIGEVHSGEESGRQLESAIERLLADTRCAGS